MSRPLPHYDERRDPVDGSPWTPNPDDVDPNQTWNCERCDVVTADPMWDQGQIVCAACAHDAGFTPAEESECPFL